MALLTQFPAGYNKPEPLNKSFDMIVRDWSRNQFGGDSIVEEIRKALNTGVSEQAAGTSAYGGGTSGQSGALRLENLDNTMTSVLATAEHLKVFRFLHKEPSKQPYYQWNRRDSYGSSRGGFGFQEGLAPQGGVGQWSRNGAYIKFLGTRGGVTHPAILTNILGGMAMDPVAEDQLGRTMDLMQRIERAIMFGDDDITDNDGKDSNYDGLLKTITSGRSGNIIDLKGKPLTFDKVAEAATRLVTEGKLLSFNDVTLFMSPQNIEDLGRLRYGTTTSASGGYPLAGPGATVDRSDLTTSGRDNLIAGMSIVGQQTAFGVIPFEWSIFTESVDGSQPLNAIGNGGKDPGALDAPTYAAGTPTLVVNAAAASTTASGKSNFDGTWVSYADANTGYFYAVSAVNDQGESEATVIAPAFTGSGTTFYATPSRPSENQQVSITITSEVKATQFRIYRSPKLSFVGTTGAAAVLKVKESISSNADKWLLVGYAVNVSTTGTNKAATGNTVTFIDRNGHSSQYNNFMPGTNIAPMLCRNPADLCVAQMSPLLKMPLAPTTTTFNYLLLLYHTLVVKSPERQFIFKNVGALV